ncbi:MAG: hypothetical protein J0I48_08785 [Devosia sp.]|uniref:hypothetical protein n=1 Tax=Devosia sp. 66-22 TaxID=1895753 RepID=UPI0009284D89|nr:hypothetical protein [Devosia sp. 66-22]MBN9346283.1 hypothetical protein [Devosia sp.]OJX55082.1 MAG: hypothetical protein BGO81_01140 [Devosia sp. 66-22]
MTSVRDFLKARRQELQAELGPLEAKLSGLRRELDEIERAEKALGPVGVDEAFEMIFQRPMHTPAKGVLKEGTIKDFVVRVLSEKPDGLVAVDILARINKRFGTKYPRTSLSPQLSRLKNEGVLERHGVVWRLAKEKGSAVGPTEPVSSDGAGVGTQGGSSQLTPAGSTPVGSTAVRVELTDEDRKLL